ncbi:MAG: RagB/SusD family nutrient uptake outer membrane protein [Janthinobacterium lividum]
MFSITRFFKAPAALGAALLLTVASGCSDFLKQDIRSSLTPGTYFANSDQAQAAINGLYDNLRLMSSTDVGYGESMWVGLELFAQHATSLGQSQFNNQILNQTIDANNPYFSNMWSNAYYGIAAANLALARIPDVSMDETQKKALLGQAYFVRAFLYYHLVRLYGDVPLITKPVDGNSPDLYPTRAAQADVYKLIVSDLQAAEQAGLPLVDHTGRITQSAAKALLSSVYLTMAGYPMQQKENYALAAAKAAEVIDAGNYPLFSNYISLHNNADKNQGELILQAQYQFGIATNAISPLVVPYFAGISNYNDEFGALIPTNGFFNTYESGDLRAEERQFYFSSYPRFKAPGGTVNFNAHALYKYFHLESALSTVTPDCDENWTLLRMPEVMLIYAEASNEAGTATAKAYTQLNAIRSRAKLPALSGLSQDAFRTAVWKERYHELAYENKAYFDIQRTRKAYDVVNNRFVDAVGFKNEVGTAFQAKYLLWGIPRAEINTNNKLTQNPGY